MRYCRPSQRCGRGCPERPGGGTQHSAGGNALSELSPLCARPLPSQATISRRKVSKRKDGTGCATAVLRLLPCSTTLQNQLDTSTHRCRMHICHTNCGSSHHFSSISRECLLVLPLGTTRCHEDGWQAITYEEMLICTFQLPFLDSKELTTHQIVE